MFPITPPNLAFKFCPLCAKRAIVHSIFLWTESFGLPLDFLSKWMTFWFCKYSFFIINLSNLSHSPVSFFPTNKRTDNMSKCQFYCEMKTIWLPTGAKSVLALILSMMSNYVPFSPAPQPHFWCSSILTSTPSVIIIILQNVFEISQLCWPRLVLFVYKC